jgi:hypothetical protein
MDQYDVMYIDDGRNSDNRRPVRPTTSAGRSVVIPPSPRPTVVYSRPTAPAPSYSAPYGTPYGAPYGTPYFGPAPSFASRFGMSTGELVDTAIQILAAIRPLPSAPVAQGESGIDVENLVTYQDALATHAKRDEQLRTLGNLLVRILK